MATRLGGTMRVRAEGRGAGLVMLIALAVVGCSSSHKPAAPALVGVAVAPGPAYLAVGSAQQFAATGTYADGSSTRLTSNLTWASSDPTVVTVSSAGLVSAVGKGSATVTATSSGVTGSTAVTARVVTQVSSVGASQPPQAAASVDASQQGYLRVSGLTPGAFYAPTLDQLTDDVDLAVYKDASLSADAQLCVSDDVGLAPESCVAPANAAGELYVVVDGSWIDRSASFVLTVPLATPDAPKSTLAFPAQLPASGSVDTTSALYKVTGLSPGASYEVRISHLTADVDLDVYGDAYLYSSACASYNSGTIDDLCTAAASAAGELYVEVDGSSTTSGGSFTLTLAAK